MWETITSTWPVLVGELLLAALGPWLLRVRGTRALLILILGLCVLVVVLFQVFQLLLFVWLGFLAVSLLLISAAVFALGRFRWPLIAQTMASILVALLLSPPALFWFYLLLITSPGGRFLWRS